MFTHKYNKVTKQPVLVINVQSNQSKRGLVDVPLDDLANVG
jgi:hypothetical protein